MRDTPIAPVVFWFGTGVALLLALELIANPFVWALVLPVAAVVYLVAAVVLLIAYIWNAIRERTRCSWLVAASIPPLVVVLALIQPLIARLVVYTEFAMRLAEYSRIIQAETGTRPPRDRSGPAGGVQYIVDVGPPLRIAFPKDGIIDNWWGIVYDPSDAVAPATAQSDAQIRGLFGGDLVSCWHIQGHYYACSFT